MKWSEFKQLIESKMPAGADPRLDFILFDVDYADNKLYVFYDKAKNELAVEG